MRIIYIFLINIMGVDGNRDLNSTRRGRCPSFLPDRLISNLLQELSRSSTFYQLLSNMPEKLTINGIISLNEFGFISDPEQRHTSKSRLHSECWQPTNTITMQDVSALMRIHNMMLVITVLQFVFKSKSHSGKEDKI